jgi:hypothetical protein
MEFLSLIDKQDIQPAPCSMMEWGASLFFPQNLEVRKKVCKFASRNIN